MENKKLELIFNDKKRIITVMPYDRELEFSQATWDQIIYEMKCGDEFLVWNLVMRKLKEQILCHS